MDVPVRAIDEISAEGSTGPVLIDTYMMNKETVTIKKGDSVCVITSGAGGWGNPLEREVELVLKDVRNGGVSVKRAREVYGVVIDEAKLEVDRQATERLRKEKR